MLKKIKYDCLKTLLTLYKNANAGHIGTSLSCLDILIYLFFYKMNPEDKFILSKGHAAAALYTVLNKSGKISEEELKTFYKDGTLLAAHPPCNKKLNGVIFGTGSLGHGLSLSTGIALSCCFTKKNFNVYCVLSDGDCNEGSTWEAALFAAQKKLSNLTVIIDNNGLQGFGKCKDIIDLEPLQNKWKDFNFETVTAENGNSFDSLNESFKNIDSLKSNKPKCIIAKTVKGSGISFMENKFEWHYLPMNDVQYETAMKEAEKFNA
ncbi:transketolase [Candidatus Dependentiae bacterium]|nr:transketolase [Candidatus Dependentiae bacterium]